MFDSPDDTDVLHEEPDRHDLKPRRVASDNFGDPGMFMKSGRAESVPVVLADALSAKLLTDCLANLAIDAHDVALCFWQCCTLIGTVSTACYASGQ
ncbi:hypothetical protein BAUCODRAFT_125617 [Baudoinia panamericana UAMH 10762]|uniref:Uncharacterized protein n=1 Tax=Baudoinia panamericana (strain UAMH 10762) TaxID=717646 RepID=M2MMK6_BAUPA|nr:uncharacterized protein BAUCODRAFT_125617 [Baudoinia panamericana UAMH 10762]EMC92638.1 hypothetical protein BAUCODRAFT_125617 [Baudoinia panamericana UAMH 10762]